LIVLCDVVVAFTLAIGCIIFYLLKDLFNCSEFD